MTSKGALFILSAPSGAGKSTLIGKLRGRVGGLGFSVSHTTRAPRPGEVEGVHYYFTDRAAFEALAAKGGFAEWAEVHGNLYGTSKAELERLRNEGLDVILDIDVQGAEQLRTALPDAVRVFILPPRPEVLESRLQGRGEEPATIARRVANARSELEKAGEYDYVVVNDVLDTAAFELAAIVTAERCRASRRLPARPK